jgi:hypothetical protein
MAPFGRVPPSVSSAATDPAEAHPGRLRRWDGALIDVERARRDTPGVDHVAHFNHAGASPMPQPVLDAVVSHLRLEITLGTLDRAGGVAQS